MGIETPFCPVPVFCPRRTAASAAARILWNDRNMSSFHSSRPSCEFLETSYARVSMSSVSSVHCSIPSRSTWRTTPRAVVPNSFVQGDFPFSS